MNILVDIQRFVFLFWKHTRIVNVGNTVQVIVALFTRKKLFSDTVVILCLFNHMISNWARSRTSYLPLMEVKYFFITKTFLQ